MSELLILNCRKLAILVMTTLPFQIFAETPSSSVRLVDCHTRLQAVKHDTGESAALPPKLFDGISYRPPNDDPSDFTRGHYYVPNEASTYLYDRFLNGQKGAIVAVGTHRGFELASRGDQKYLILMDIDAGIVEWNEYQIKILKTSATPKQFIANFLGDPDLFTNYPKIDEYFEAEDTTRLLSEFSRLTLPKVSAVELDKRIKYLLHGFPNEQYGVLSIHSPNPRRSSFLWDPERYQRIRVMALEGRIVCVHGSLAGPEFTVINQRLAAAGIRVSLLDVSNVPDYILHQYLFHLELMKPDDPRIKIALALPGLFRAGLATVPWTDDAQVLFTTKHASLQSIDNGWNYFAMPFARYQRLVAPVNREFDYSNIFLTNPEVLAASLRL